MDEHFGDMLASLRDSQRANDQELRPLLEAQPPDWSMLMRLRDVADEHAGRARVLRQMMKDSDADPAALMEVDQLCAFFDGTAALIAQETGDEMSDKSVTRDGETGQA
jgi:hypothetical protein